jgi:hypothetical protein
LTLKFGSDSAIFIKRGFRPVCLGCPVSRIKLSSLQQNQLAWHAYAHARSPTWRGVFVACMRIVFWAAAEANREKIVESNSYTSWEPNRTLSLPLFLRLGDSIHQETSGLQSALSSHQVNDTGRGKLPFSRPNVPWTEAKVLPQHMFGQSSQGIWDYDGGAVHPRLLPSVAERIECLMNESATASSLRIWLIVSSFQDSIGRFLTVSLTWNHQIRCIFPHSLCFFG